MDESASQARDVCVRRDGKWHDGFVDHHLCDVDFFGPCIADVELDLISFERVTFNAKFFHWRGGLQIEPSACGEEEHDHPNEENDWDEEQDEGPESEACVGWVGC